MPPTRRPHLLPPDTSPREGGPARTGEAAIDRFSLRSGLDRMLPAEDSGLPGRFAAVRVRTAASPDSAAASGAVLRSTVSPHPYPVTHFTPDPMPYAATCDGTARNRVPRSLPAPLPAV